MGSKTVALPLKMIVLVLLWPALLLATEVPGEGATSTPADVPALRPTRAALYSHLASELEAVAGAEEHVRAAYAALLKGVDDTVVHGGVVARLQTLVDGVVEAAEDAWVAADEARRTAQVKPCVDNAETDAQKVVKGALEKMRGCVEGLEAEGQRRAREAAKLVNDIEGLSKRFVTELEVCVKAEAARETSEPAPAPAAAAPEEPLAAPIPTDLEAPQLAGSCPRDAADPEPAKEEAPTQGKVRQCPGQKKAAEPTQGHAEDKPVKKAKVAKGKKAPAEKAATEEEQIPDEETVPQDKVKKYEKKQRTDKKYKRDHLKKPAKNVVEEEIAGGPEGVTTEGEGKEGNKAWKEGKYGEEKVKGKGKSGKGKKEQSNVEASESVEEKQSKGKDGNGKKEGKRKKDNASNQESVEGKTTKGGKREGKGKSEKDGKKSKEGSEEGKGRKTRSLLWVEEDVAQLEEETTKEAEPVAGDPPSAEVLSAGSAGSTPEDPEERRVKACLSSPTIATIMADKMRAYQRLQSVLQRVAAKEEELRQSTCIADIENKANRKVHAISERMRSCADRKMRDEL